VRAGLAVADGDDSQHQFALGMVYVNRHSSRGTVRWQFSRWTTKAHHFLRSRALSSTGLHATAQLIRPGVAARPTFRWPIPLTVVSCPSVSQQYNHCYDLISSILGKLIVAFARFSLANQGRRRVLCRVA
jgi:hypothetical protein